MWLAPAANSPIQSSSKSPWKPANSTAGICNLTNPDSSKCPWKPANSTAGICKLRLETSKFNFHCCCLLLHIDNPGSSNSAGFQASNSALWVPKLDCHTILNYYGKIVFADLGGSILYFLGAGHSKLLLHHSKIRTRVNLL